VPRAALRHVPRFKLVRSGSPWRERHAAPRTPRPSIIPRIKTNARRVQLAAASRSTLPHTCRRRTEAGASRTTNLKATAIGTSCALETPMFAWSGRPCAPARRPAGDRPPWFTVERQTFDLDCATKEQSLRVWPPRRGFLDASRDARRIPSTVAQGAQTLPTIYRHGCGGLASSLGLAAPPSGLLAGTGSEPSPMHRSYEMTPSATTVL
jgi:hypothetical protein